MAAIHCGNKNGTTLVSKLNEVSIVHRSNEDLIEQGDCADVTAATSPDAFSAMIFFFHAYLLLPQSQTERPIIRRSSMALTT